MFFEWALAASVNDFSEKKVPGSEITLTLSVSGKYFAKLSLITFDTPVYGEENYANYVSNESQVLITIVSVSRPGNPPPISNKSIFNPKEFPYSNAAEESLIACAKISYSKHPTPIWKATPLMFKSSSLALRNKNSLVSPGMQPNFSPNPILFVVAGSKRKRNNNLKQRWW